MKTFEAFGIKIPAGATGNIKTICPSCTPHNRKPKNKNAKDLSVDVANGVFQCWNCGWKGSLNEAEQKEYFRPELISLPLSEKVVSWFKGRGINEQTLKHFQISEKREWMPQVDGESNCIVFPYLKEGRCVNMKFRDGSKNFKMVKNAELCLFNFDGVVGKSVAVITEGEIDAMSVFESGLCLSGEVGVSSVPNGAAKGNQRLEYLDNSWQAFNGCEKIIIATDNDEPGIALKAELSRRLGKHRCFDISYQTGCKDLNEVLIQHGSAGVIECLTSSRPMPVEGIHRLIDFDEDVDYAFENGFDTGDTIGFDELDKHINFSPGQVTVVTGVPGSGKSTFLDQVLIRLSSRRGWKHGLCSFEKQPITKHISNLAQCYIGKPFYRPDPSYKMSKDQKDKAKAWLNENFYWFKVRNEDVSVDGILTRAAHLVKAHGIKGLVIDPYNYVEHVRKGNQTETEYVSEVLTKLCDFAKDYGVHIFLVAHPTKMGKKSDGEFEVPTLYNISGSHNFFAKPDNGITVHRNRKDGTVTVYIQKIRFEPENGKLGYADFNFDRDTGRYKEFSEMAFAVEYLWKPEMQQVDLFVVEQPHKGFKNRFVEDAGEAPF